MMPTAGRILTISRIELRRFLRERSNIFFVFVLPLALVIFIGLQFGAGATTQLGAVHPDDDAAHALVERIGASDNIEVVTITTADELRSLVSRGNLSGGLVIEEGFGRSLASGSTFEIGYVGRPDGTGRSLRSVVYAALADQSAISRAARIVADASDRPMADMLALAAELRTETSTVAVTTESVGGDDLAAEFAGLGQFDLGASAQLFLFVFLTSLAGSAALIQTRQLGIASRMLSTPTRLPVILLGLAGGRFLVAVFQALYIILVTAVVFDVNWGDPLATTVLVVLFCLVSTGAALVVGSLFSNDSQASGAGVGIGLVMAALGGSMVPLEIFPAGMRTVARFTPHGWANAAIAEIVRRDGTVADVTAELTVLAGFAVLLLAGATWLLRRALTR